MQCKTVIHGGRTLYSVSPNGCFKARQARNVMDKSRTPLSITKIDLITNQKPVSTIDFGFAINHQLNLLKNTKKVTDGQMIQFKKDAAEFLAQMCNHLIEKCPLCSHLARCLKGLSPVFKAEYPETSEKVFEKILTKLNGCKIISPMVADKAKS